MNDQDPYELNDSAPDPPAGGAGATEPTQETPQAPSAAAGQLSATCPGCGESLAGLPIGGACPQCGWTIGAADHAIVQKTSGKAITAMVLGICSIPACFCYGVLSVILAGIGLVFAHLAGKEIQAGGYSEASKSMNLAGKICCWIGLGIGACYMLFWIIMIVLMVTTKPTP